MYFKKLELIGFKSFADKTSIEFEAGVTAIVGPNGCGKSNISDAIRWVLGEQSAKSLRGSSMEDVIFNGSSAKEPMNYAEVALTLSNESRILPIDYDEVTIARRLYRSGESEYLLNKNNVRLRDIHEMLMGTGIGTESYSIIEQGKMDVILNSKPEDRRVIFEEAAGITKFKSQKKEALRKLEQTDQNLLRVNDIIQEVRRQIASVERQAKKAEAYKIEFEKLKNLELGVASREFFIFDNEKSSKERELEDLRMSEEEIERQAEELDHVYLSKRETLESLDQRLKDGSTREILASSEIRKNQDRILLNRERVGELLERRENLSRQLEAAQKRIEEFAAEYEKLTLEFTQAQEEEAAGLLFLGSVEGDFRLIEDFVKSATAETDQARASIAELSSKKQECQSQLLRLQAEIGTIASRLERLKLEETSLRTYEEKAEQEFERVQQNLAQEEEILAEKISSKNARETELESVRADIQTTETVLDQAQMEESSSRSKLDFLNDLKNRHEGFWGGVKALLDEKTGDSPSVSGMIGAFADLLRVQPGYEFAAEAALESYLQAVLFETDDQVVSALEFLRAQGKGRALLFSREIASADHVASPDIEGAQKLSTYVQTEESLAPVLHKLLANVYVASNAQDAFRLAKNHPGIVCVTVDGERFEGGVASGGKIATEADLTLIGRESRIHDCETHLSQASAAVLNAREHLTSLKNRETTIHFEIKEISEQILQFQMKLGDGRSSLRHLEDEKKRISENLSRLVSEVASIENEERSYRSEEAVLSKTYSEISESEASLGVRVAELDAAIREKAQDRETLLIRLAETRSRQGAFTARREKIEKDKHWVLESKASQEELTQSYVREMEEAVAKKETLEHENATLDEALSRLTEERDEILREIEALRIERETEAAALAVVEKDRHERQKALEDLRRKLHEYQMQTAQIGFEIDRLKERIFNSYQVDIAIHDEIHALNAMIAPGQGDDAGFDLEKAKADIQAQRDKLNKMGPVNLVAIEEHVEMKARFEFLTQQEQDLIKAKEDLHKAILKINRTTKELFAETFAKVQKNFTEYFRLLFNGGTAELVLLDQEDILESGIEIVARPPGKKPQSITLLSGGEKAMTAVALMFSLFKVKPSPFCILDEIDAPLDETNVERFCNVLKDFITGSQFILITHNKRTMNLSDAMYGITMAQTGVSRVVSVKFGDKHKEVKKAGKTENQEALVS